MSRAKTHGGGGKLPRATTQGGGKKRASTQANNDLFQDLEDAIDALDSSSPRHPGKPGGVVAEAVSSEASKSRPTAGLPPPKRGAPPGAKLPSRTVGSSTGEPVKPPAAAPPSHKIQRTEPGPTPPAAAAAVPEAPIKAPRTAPPRPPPGAERAAAIRARESRAASEVGIDFDDIEDAAARPAPSPPAPRIPPRPPVARTPETPRLPATDQDGLPKITPPPTRSAAPIPPPSDTKPSETSGARLLLRFDPPSSSPPETQPPVDNPSTDARTKPPTAPPRPDAVRVAKSPTTPPPIAGPSAARGVKSPTTPPPIRAKPATTPPPSSAKPPTTPPPPLAARVPSRLDVPPPDASTAPVPPSIPEPRVLRPEAAAPPPPLDASSSRPRANDPSRPAVDADRPAVRPVESKLQVRPDGPGAKRVLDAAQIQAPARPITLELDNDASAARAIDAARSRPFDDDARGRSRSFDDDEPAASAFEARHAFDGRPALDHDDSRSRGLDLLDLGNDASGARIVDDAAEPRSRMPSLDLGDDGPEPPLPDDFDPLAGFDLDDDESGVRTAGSRRSRSEPSGHSIDIDMDSQPAAHRYEPPVARSPRPLSEEARAISVGETPEEDVVIEGDDPIAIRSLSVAILDEPPYLPAAKQAIAVAGHRVVAAASGQAGIEQIKSLMRSGTADALLVAVPGGEALIETALALAPRRPVVIALTPGKAVDATKRAASVGADLAMTRPVDVEKLAPVMFAASRLVVERQTATNARGSETMLKARLDALVDHEPGALQPFELFQRVLELELKRSKRYGYPIAVALFAVTVGGLDEDEVPPPGVHGILRARAGNALIHSIRDIDLATELDQERFLVLLPYTSLGGAAEVARRILGAVNSGNPITAAGKQLMPEIVGAVAGAMKGQPLSFSRLMRDATQALEQARRDGAELAVPMTRDDR